MKPVWDQTRATASALLSLSRSRQDKRSVASSSESVSKAALVRLPADERSAYTQLLGDVAALLNKALK
jgi:hypothetical protein